MQEIENILAQFNLVQKNFSLYDGKHPDLQGGFKKLTDMLNNYCFSHRKLVLAEANGRLVISGHVETKKPGFDNFAGILKAHHINSIAFNTGLELKEVMNLCKIFNMKPSFLKKEDVEKKIKEADFKHLEVGMFSIEILREDKYGVAQGIPKDKTAKGAVVAKKQILVVEDNIELLKTYREELMEENYDVIEASNGNDALVVMEQRGLPDLMILDIKMPGMHGMEVLEKMKLKKYNVPVIIATAYPAMKDDFTVKTFPNLEFLVKPFSSKVLYDTIRKMLK